MRRLVATGALVGASLSMFACSSEVVAPTGECEVVTNSGEVLHPTGYPLGAVAVRYHTGASWTDARYAEGTIEQEGQNYYVALSDLPTNLNNDGVDNNWNNTDAVVFVQTPTLEVGLTPDCIERDKLNQYGIPAVRANLPTAPPA